MKTPSISSVAYAPGIAPFDQDQFRQFVENELRNIASAISLLASGHIDTSYAAPTKPRAGDIRLADGTTWNPGSGAGVYCYYGSAWNKLG